MSDIELILSDVRALTRKVDELTAVVQQLAAALDVVSINAEETERKISKIYSVLEPLFPMVESAMGSPVPPTSPLLMPLPPMTFPGFKS